MGHPEGLLAALEVQARLQVALRADLLVQAHPGVHHRGMALLKAVLQAAALQAAALPAVLSRPPSQRKRPGRPRGSA